MSTAEAWICPEHGLVEETYVKANGDEAAYCLHDHDGAQELRRIQLASADDLAEARAATALAQKQAEEWKTKFVQARVELAETKGVVPPIAQGDITTEAAANLVKEARDAQAVADRQRIAAEDQVIKWRDRHDQVNQKLTELQARDTDITREAAENLVEEARSALREAEKGREDARAEVDRWKTTAGRRAEEIKRLQAIPAVDPDITKEAAANLVEEARAAQRAAETSREALLADRDSWKAQAQELRGTNLRIKQELEQARNADSDITKEAAENLVAEARSAQEAAEHDRDKHKAETLKWQQRHEDARTEADSARRRLREAEARDVGITDEAAANLVAEARSAHEAAELARADAMKQVVDWRQRYGRMRDEAIAREDQLRAENAEAVQTATTIAQEAASNLVEEARSAQQTAERERDMLKRDVSILNGRIQSSHVNLEQVLDELEQERAKQNSEGITTEAAANLVRQERSAKEGLQRERDQLISERDQWRKLYGEARSEAADANRRLREDQEGEEDQSIEVEAITNLLAEAREDLAQARSDVKEAERQVILWRRNYGEARSDATEAQRLLREGNDDGVSAEATANLLREERAARETAERDLEIALRQRDEWRGRFGASQSELVNAERQQRVNGDTTSQLRAKREQLAELDNIARDASRFLATLDVREDSVDTERRLLLRRLRAATS